MNASLSARTPYRQTQTDKIHIKKKELNKNCIRDTARRRKRLLKGVLTGTFRRFPAFLGKAPGCFLRCWTYAGGEGVRKCQAAGLLIGFTFFSQGGKTFGECLRKAVILQRCALDYKREKFLVKESYEGFSTFSEFLCKFTSCWIGLTHLMAKGGKSSYKITTNVLLIKD